MAESAFAALQRCACIPLQSARLFVCCSCFSRAVHEVVAATGRERAPLLLCGLCVVVIVVLLCFRVAVQQILRNRRRRATCLFSSSALPFGSADRQANARAACRCRAATLQQRSSVLSHRTGARGCIPDCSLCRLLCAPSCFRCSGADGEQSEAQARSGGYQRRRSTAGW